MLRGAFVLTVTSGLSYVLGLLRDRILAGAFGASDVRDVYEAAFILPDILFNLFLAGALVSAFVPVFIDLRVHKKDTEAQELAGGMLVLGTLILLIACGVVFIFAHPLTALVAPGFPPAKRELLASLTRLMLLSPLLFLVSNLVGSMLISTQRFVAYGLSPIFYNLGIVGGALFLAPSFGIRGVVFGTLGGAALHLGVRVIGLWRAGIGLAPSLRITPALRRVVLLMLPRVVGLTAGQGQLWAFLAIASTLGEGAVTVNSLARNFQSFPVSILGIAFATSLFPLLSESGSLRDRTTFGYQLRRGLLLTLAAVVPAAALLYALREWMITLLLGTGAFGPDAIARTAAVLGVYTLSIPTESLVHILARAFYALQNTLIPMLVNLMAIAASVITAWALSHRFGVASIPVGFALGTALQVLILGAALRWYTQRVFTDRAASE